MANHDSLSFVISEVVDAEHVRLAVAYAYVGRDVYLPAVVGASPLFHKLAVSLGLLAFGHRQLEARACPELLLDIGPRRIEVKLRQIPRNRAQDLPRTVRVKLPPFRASPSFLKNNDLCRKEFADQVQDFQHRAWERGQPFPNLYGQSTFSKFLIQRDCALVRLVASILRMPEVVSKFLYFTIKFL